MALPIEVLVQAAERIPAEQSSPVVAPPSMTAEQMPVVSQTVDPSGGQAAGEFIRAVFGDMSAGSQNVPPATGQPPTAQNVQTQGEGQQLDLAPLQAQQGPEQQVPDQDLLLGLLLRALGVM